jgi:hypothetical protein
MKTLRTLALALIAAALLAAAAVAFAQSNPAQSAENSVRPELAKPLIAAQEAIKAKNWPEALARLKEAEAVPNRTPYETFVTDRTRGAAALGAGDVPLALQSFDAVLASPLLPASERAGLLEGMVQLAYGAKDYAKAISLADRYAQAGGVNPEIAKLRVQAMYLSDDFKGAATASRHQVEADEAAGRKPDEQTLRLWASSAAKLNDAAQYSLAAERLLAHYPSPKLWSETLARLPSQPGFADRLRLDLLRLRLATGTMSTADQYLAMAQLAQTAGLPGEAKKVLDAGFAAGVLGQGTGAAEHRKLQAAAAKAAADDEKSLLAARPGADNNLNFSTGFALATIDQFDKGLPMMEAAVAKGGLRKPADAGLHLGQAYLAAGQPDKALGVWKTVQGGDGSADLARLWAVLARQQGAAR